MKHIITALYADKNGEIFDAPDIIGVGRIGSDIVKLQPEDLIKLPDSADLMFLPNRRAVGLTKSGELKVIKGQAVSAILPAGYTRTHLPAFECETACQMLPLYGYTAVVLYRNELYTTAIYTDENHKWDPIHYNTRELKKLVRRVKKDLPNNRIVEQVANCSLSWHCCTAQNLFYRRWEAGIPTSPTCNAKCLGCISLQPAECCPSPQSRITFKPTVEEIAEVGLYHLTTAPEAIISFGQGCEGEPSLMANNIAEAIKLIRSKTDGGQININSNAGFTEGIKKIVDAGLDSIRVSIISANEESYNAYYRAAYKLNNVKESIKYALDKGVYVSLNMLYFPGFNDREEELAAWIKFFEELSVQMIQVRNLNIDPDVFLKMMLSQRGKIIGTKKFLNTLSTNFKHLQIGSFSHYINEE
ncbi:MAG: radical SAM protein [Selenomonadaceae bacterium]|nr:radical SAM protein [Selenomonadaceae bacterium]